MVEDLNTDIFDSTCPLHYAKEIPRKEKQLVQRHKDIREEFAGIATIKHWLRNCLFCLLIFTYNKRLSCLRTFFSLIGKCCVLPCQSFPAEVLWIKYSCALEANPLIFGTAEQGWSMRRPQASHSSWFYPDESYEGLPFSLLTRACARMWKKDWPSQQPVLPQFGNSLSGARSLSGGRVHAQADP